MRKILEAAEILLAREAPEAGGRAEVSIKKVVQTSKGRSPRTPGHDQGEMDPHALYTPVSAFSGSSSSTTATPVFLDRRTAYSVRIFCDSLEPFGFCGGFIKKKSVFFVAKYVFAT